MRRSFALSIILVFMLGAMVFAQQGFRQDRPFRANRNFDRMDRGYFQGRMLERIPGLTDGQKEQLKNLQIEHLRAVKEADNGLIEKRAQLRILSTEDNADQKKINAKIDEIGKLQTERMKERERHHQAVRKMLTEEQRVVFDSLGRRMGGNRSGRGMQGRGMRGAGPCLNFQY